MTTRLQRVARTATTWTVAGLFCLAASIVPTPDADAATGHAKPARVLVSKHAAPTKHHRGHGSIYRNTRTHRLESAHGVPLQRDGRVKFSGKASRIISDKGVRIYLADTAREYGTSVGFEQDVLGCGIAYPSVKSTKYGECVDYSLAFHY